MTTRIPRPDYVREKLQSQTMKKDVIIYKASDELAKELTARMEKKAEELRKARDRDITNTYSKSKRRSY